MKTVYKYLPEALADWETGLAVAELNTQRFFKDRGNLEVKTFALSKKPVRTMGGLTLLPDHELAEVKKEHAVLLILPGAETWMEPQQDVVLELAADFLRSGIPVAAICGATEAMAARGMLNEVEHTSNGLDFLKMTCPEYKGAHYYRDQPVVTAGDLITAGSSSSVAFAYHIIKKLELMQPEALEYWYGYFERHSTEDIMKLFHMLQPQAD